MGVFDEGCMGMFNAIIPDELLHPTGVYKERLSQSALYARMLTVTDAEARAVFDWYKKKGVQFHFGPSEEEDLTETQVLQQCKMYIAAVRIADEFGCGTIGIQYQQGLKDLAPASDLVEGTLNNVDRPPVTRDGSKEVLYKGEALPHFNEVDECAGLDGYVTYRLWRELGFAAGKHSARPALGPAVHRETDGKELDAYVWVFLISGAVPPAHLIGGWKGVTSQRQPPMYFRLGGGTITGVSKPGWIVWSRVFVEEASCGSTPAWPRSSSCRAKRPRSAGGSPRPQWPIMHAVLQGITRDQMMARHKSNHIQVAYAPDKAGAKKALFAKAAAMQELGLDVSVCGAV